MTGQITRLATYFLHHFNPSSVDTLHPTAAMDRTRRPQQQSQETHVESTTGSASSGNGRDSASAIAFDDSELNYRQVRQLTQRLRSALGSSGDVDGAYREYVKVKDHASLCRSLLRTSSNSDDNDNTAKQQPDREKCLEAIREWRDAIQALLQALRASLAETYVGYEPAATPAMLESLFKDKEFRAAAIQGMRNARIEGRSSVKGFSRARYDVRFRNYDSAEKEWAEALRVLHLAESGIREGREVREVVISERGDAVLEFANLGREKEWPVVRFWVSEDVLAEASGFFARVFRGGGGKRGKMDDEEEEEGMVRRVSSSEYVCEDGRSVRIYRMPHLEDDRESSLSVLLHAAHLHNEHIPRAVSFDAFVAVARTCLRYECTSPLEVVVEHRWLPAWIHKSSETMPDGMLVISYAFGFRQLFARMSKTAVLNLLDWEEVKGKEWPGRMKERIWGVREAKMGQVYGVCGGALGEYLRPPAEGGDSGTGVPAGDMPLTRTPRCPRGDHICDATNLGWLMLIFAELQLLPAVMNFTSTDTQQLPRRSLAQLVEQLRKIPSPPHAVHRTAACDPAPLLRAAVNDVYNSVSGLTLHDVSGRAHGWGLSRHRSRTVQAVLQRGLRRMGEEKKENDKKKEEEWKRKKEEKEERGKKRGEMTDAVRLGILREVDTVEDLYAAALASRAFYKTFKYNEASLVGRFVRAQRRRTLMRLTSMDVVAGGEDKVPKSEGDAIRAEGAGSEDGRDEELPPSSDTGEGSEGGMTDEEARRVLWPEEQTWATTSEGIPEGEGMREKFRVGDPAFREDKMLLGAEEKQLRQDRDRRVGLLRDDE
ncbi:hypothetical protein CPLU01_05068 [Colletotrichum plurivorum]|uniref:Uncharacterized protein n=1 Tax=Colletotrichum plurivorum TaxID=2175906 RepID=A0A8H6NHY2_9PEZI|nr:hypothetical protein CPLU01_05068 [Colletotrichum plurivorum]